MNIKEILLGAVLGSIGTWGLILAGQKPSSEPPPTPGRFELIVTSGKWDDNSPIIYKLDNVYGTIWANGKGKDTKEQWYEIEDSEEAREKSDPLGLNLK